MINKDNFLKPSDPRLSQMSKPIAIDEIQSEETKQVIKKMHSVAYGEQTDEKKPLLVGLAAPQIGIPKRIIFVDIAANGIGGIGDLRVFINPKITWKSDEEQEWYEGCFSTCGIVSRALKIKLTYFSEDGESHEEEFEGYTARIFQHEVDHLDGEVFAVHITDDNNLHWVEDSDFPEYRNNEAWRHWEKKYSIQKWLSSKGLV